jgi:hypothetical protein
MNNRRHKSPSAERSAYLNHRKAYQEPYDPCLKSGNPWRNTACIHVGDEGNENEKGYLYRSHIIAVCKSNRKIAIEIFLNFVKLQSRCAGALT